MPSIPLQLSDFRHLQAAIGYVELGMCPDASSELDEIDPNLQESPDILAVRLFIYQTSKQWDLMQKVALDLVRQEPTKVDWIISLAYSTRRVEGIPEARAILEAALGDHPMCATIPYNLACYACRMNELEKAMDLLQDAFELDSRMRLVALQDEDLLSLRNTI